MTDAIPQINISQAKMDALARDLQKLEMDSTTVVGGGQLVPAFQRQGYLEKMGHTRTKWFRRFFVLRDSFLLSYNLQKSDYTVEPRTCINLSSSQFQLLPEADKLEVFSITTMERDQFFLGAQSSSERDAWIKDMEVARTITHANMVKLAVENQCLAEEKGLGGVTRDNSTSALSIFCNNEYIRNTPLTGGAEGWLRTLGFNPDFQAAGKKKLKKCYFMLRDSHLLMFNGGDILTKPRGVMYLVGTTTEKVEDEEGMFKFACRSKQCGDVIELVASSNKQRQRWIQALQVGARVTYPDFKLLLKEHQLLAAVTMTPRAAPPTAPNQPAIKVDAPPVPLMTDDMDVQGQQLDPATQQAYDSEGVPLVRDPEGKLVHGDGSACESTEDRYNAEGQQLDPFNRPLPPGAVPMFTADGQAIGVGPDGKHYLPNGDDVTDQAHFAADGTELKSEVVEAAGAIATDVSVALKARAMLKGEGATEEMVDMLGRTFRAMEGEGEGTVLKNADGQEVPLKSSRKVEQDGKLVDYDYSAPKPVESGELTIMMEQEEGDEVELGTVEVDSYTTLKDLRNTLTVVLESELPNFVFLVNMIPLLKHEEDDKLAFSLMPCVFVRSNELKVEAPKMKFTKKVEKMVAAEQKAKAEANEFEDIMAKIRAGKFLKPVKDSIMDE